MPERAHRRLPAAAERGTLAPVVVLAPPPQASAPRATGRDRRLDVFRGIALAMIFVNHVPGTVYETLTSRNFGFSDAAEGFVFMAGVSAALAYGPGLAAGPRTPTVLRVWGRSWTLYLVHLLILAWALAIAAGTERFFGVPDLLSANNIQHLGSDLTGVLVGLPLLTHQPGYVNILPLYTILLLAAPAAILAAHRHPKATMAASVALWAVAGVFTIDLPNFPTEGGWFFNPLAWQILFVAGLCTGLALRRGRRFVPASPWLFALSAGYLALSLVWVRWPAFAAVGNEAMAGLGRLGAPPLLRDFDKTYVALPRLLHILCLVYVVSCLAPLRRFSESRWAAPLALLGRQALPVFALGTILAFLAQAGRAIGPDSILLDTALIAAGLALMLAMAAAREWARRQTRPVPALPR